jgi:hypothetical protein
MNLLNLDEVSKAKRQITLGGVDYDVVDQSVGQMISSIQVQKLLSNVEGNEVEVMSELLKSVQEIIPTCPESKIRTLSMSSINAIFDFIGTPDKEVIENSKEDTGEVVEGTVEKK